MTENEKISPRMEVSQEFIADYEYGLLVDGHFFGSTKGVSTKSVQ